MNMRLSDKQREILTMIADACEPRYTGLRGRDEPSVIPFYSGHLPDVFDNYRHERRFIQNLESRGFIRIEKSHFLYIEDLGLRALGRKKG